MRVTPPAAAPCCRDATQSVAEWLGRRTEQAGRRKQWTMWRPALARVQPCSGQSRRGLKAAEQCESVAHRPALTAPARGPRARRWAGAKKRSFGPNKETVLQKRQSTEPAPTSARLPDLAMRTAFAETFTDSFWETHLLYSTANTHREGRMRLCWMELDNLISFWTTLPFGLFFFWGSRFKFRHNCKCNVYWLALRVRQ